MKSKGKECCQNYSMKPYYMHSKTGQGHNKISNYIPTCLMNIDAKFSIKYWQMNSTAYENYHAT
jgi:hypothetical protein